MKTIAVTLVGPLALGLSVLILLGFRGTKRLDVWLLMACWGVAIGIGASTALFFVVTQFIPASAANLFLTECAFALFCLVLSPFLRTPFLPPHSNCPPGDSGLRAAGFWTGLVAWAILFLMVAYTLIHWKRFPDGGWDAFAIWNLRARFLFLGGEGWKDVFSLLGFHRPDHPVMLSSFIARSWFLIGEERESVYPTIAIASTLLTAAVLYSGLQLFRNRLAANLGVILMFLPGSVMANVPLFLSDLPFTLYVTCASVSFVMGSSGDRGTASRFLPTGIFLGIAAWTKGEGLVWMVAFLFALFLRGLLLRQLRSDLRICGWILLGGGPFLLTLFWFKLSVPFEEIRCLIPAFPLTGLKNIFDLERDLRILGLVFFELLKFGGLYWWCFPLLLYLGGVSKDSEARRMTFFLLGVLLLASLGYLAAFVVTPNAIKNYISGSMGRVQVHFWPTLVLGGLLLSRLGFLGCVESQLRDKDA